MLAAGCGSQEGPSEVNSTREKGKHLFFWKKTQRSHLCQHTEGLGRMKAFFQRWQKGAGLMPLGPPSTPRATGMPPSSFSPSPRGKNSPGTSGNSDASLQPNRGKINKPRYAQPEKQTAWRRGEQRRAYGFFLCASHLIWTKSPRKRHCMNAHHAPYPLHPGVTRGEGLWAGARQWGRSLPPLTAAPEGFCCHPIPGKWGQKTLFVGFVALVQYE